MNQRSTKFARQESTHRLHRFEAAVERVLANTDEEGVHDLRVSIRRLTAVLRLFSPEFGAKNVRKVRRWLKLIMTAAGSVRDRDIALELLTAAGVPAESELMTTVDAQLQHARSELRKAISRASDRDFQARLEL